jgi:hypothetical protein
MLACVSNSLQENLGGGGKQSKAEPFFLGQMRFYFIIILLFSIFIFYLFMCSKELSFTH